MEDSFQVAIDASRIPRTTQGIWTSELILPLYTTTASGLILVLHLLSTTAPFKALFRKRNHEEEQHPARSSHVGLVAEVKAHVQKHGGTTIFGFHLARLLFTVGLLGLAIVSLVLDVEEDGKPAGSILEMLKKKRKKKKKHSGAVPGGMNDREWLEFGMTLTFFYAFLLAVISVCAKPRWSRVVVRHLNTLLLATLGVFVYRNIYPLALFNGQPLDARDGWLIWTKMALLSITAVVIPLLIPRPYIPYNPKNPSANPNPEQTTCLLFLTFYFFMDPIIFGTKKNEHIAYDQLPPLADYDHAENLRKRAFRHMDPSLHPKRRHLFFTLVRVFFWEFAIMSLMCVLQVIAEFSTPIAVKGLLSYLEQVEHGIDISTGLRPWFWIMLMFFGPSVASIAFEWYIFVGMRAVVQAESTVTQVVFEHALRIRLKSETDSEKSQQKLSKDTIRELAGSSTIVTSSRESTLVSSMDEDNDVNSVGSSTIGASSSHAREETLVEPTSSNDAKAQTPTPDAKAVNPVVGLEPSIKSKAEAGNLTGRITNLVSTDLQTVVDSKGFIRLLFYVPTQLVLCVVFLYFVLGWSAFVGMGVIIVCFPFPGLLASYVRKIQDSRMKETDARVQNVTEVMNVIRMVKMFGWEQKMNDRISDKREKELLWIWKLRLLSMATSLANYIIPILTMVATYATYLNQSMTAKVSLDRITNFLYDTELLDRYSKDEQKDTPHSNPQPTEAEVEPSQDIGFRNATFSWSHSQGSETPNGNKRQFLLRIDGELLFKKGCINMVIGPTGCGKTSLLMALLSEMHYIPEKLDSWYNLPREGGVAYAAQESWVLNATIKDNIVFGAPFDEERYKMVLHQCCLESDLVLFGAGDQTEVGEKGVTLSGGQKARVTLARAIYSRADILLLDDVLAALDVHTSKWIVEKCFNGDLVKGRTVIVVTHNVAMVQPLAEYTISLNDGRVVSQGSVNDALAKNKKLAAEVKLEEEFERKADAIVDPVTEEGQKTDGKLILAEEVEIGHLGWSALKLWLLSLGGKRWAIYYIFFVGSFLCTDLLETIQVWYLGYWAEQYNVHPPEEVNPMYHIGVYSIMVCFVVVGYCSAFSFYVFGSLRASRTIHKRLITSVLGTTMRWLDTTPTSRVITRCTQDIRDVDDGIGQMFATLIAMTSSMLMKFFAVVLFTPAFLGPAVLVTLIGLWCGQIYIRSQMAVKREMANAKAPVLAHFGSAIAGLTSIRAYGVEEDFKKESRGRINRYARPARTFYNLNRWIDVRIDAIGNLFSTSLAIYLVYIAQQKPSNTGYSLNMAVGFSGMILWWIRFVNMFEIQGNSLERINGYINIEQEPKSTEAGKPPAYWPASGELRVESLAARYSADGPKVLKNISFDVKSGERIGVVGRTGSGKSSLMLSLLRCILTEGEVYYDGLPTSKLNLQDLRSKITIIPQMPELISGDVRENLDPFGQYEDATLNDALRASGLFALQQEGDQDRITLDSAIASSGSNLSVGQRQILALARAIVRGSKLFILDEATSAIDYSTDSIIQSSLRRELGNDVTLITVAHRLQTIMDADKIMVLHEGSIVEFDSPLELLKIEGGKLRSLVDESGDKDHLYKLASRQATST